jgi:opacity protein-like surface antigen
MKNFLLLAAFALTLAFGTGQAQAQTATFNDKSDIYVGYQFVRVNPNVNEPNFKFDRQTDSNGVNTALTYFPGNKSVGVTSELAANFSGGRYDSSLVTGQVGVTIKDRTGKFNPFVRGLVGASRIRAANEQTNIFDRSNTGLALTAGVGADYKVSDKVALRLIQVDYLQTRVYGDPAHNVRVGAGIVF